jgi:hypothetical protein
VPIEFVGHEIIDFANSGGRDHGINVVKVRQQKFIEVKLVLDGLEGCPLASMGLLVPRLPLG